MFVSGHARGPGIGVGWAMKGGGRELGPEDTGEKSGSGKRWIWEGLR